MIVTFYVVAYKRENGKMSTVQKGADEETWYHYIVKNFALLKDADLNAQRSTDVGTPVATTISKKVDAPKADILKEEKKKGSCTCNTAEIPVSNPDNPKDVESSPEPLVGTKAVKRKKPEGEAAVQSAKKITRKKIGKKGNLDAFVAKYSPEKLVPSVHAESSSVFHDDLPPSPPCASIKEQWEGTKTVEVEVKKTVETEVEKTMRIEVETEKTTEVEMADAGVTKPNSPEVVAQGLEKEKLINEVPVITVPSSSVPASELPTNDVQENPVHVEQGFFIHDEEENSPIRPDETLVDYYFRTYSEKGASDINAPVWKLKQGNTFSD
ncbi:hypothetical protein Hanom_Chr03g00196691 [Helianthus anomalus]